MSWYILGPFIHGTRSDWSQQKHFAWLWPALYCFPVSTLGEKLGYKVLFSRQEAQCQPFVNLFCKMFAQKPLCLLKRIKTGFVTNPEHCFWVNFFPPLLTTLEILCCMKEIKAIVQSWPERYIPSGENCSRSFSSFILLWHHLMAVVSTTRVWLRFRKCFVTSMVCASRQLLHWAAPSAIAQWH